MATEEERRRCVLLLRNELSDQSDAEQEQIRAPPNGRLPTAATVALSCVALLASLALAVGHAAGLREIGRVRAASSLAERGLTVGSSSTSPPLAAGAELSIFDLVAAEIAGETTATTATTATTSSPSTSTTHLTVTRTSASATTTVSTTSLTSPLCDSCCPSIEQRPTVVIPVWERDLCKMRVTAHSILHHDPGRLLGKVIICWVSHFSAGDFEEDLHEIKNLLSMHGEVEVVEMKLPEDVGGWFAQQSAKLKVANLVKTDYYVVLDAKNSLLRRVTEELFFTSCHQAKVFGHYNLSNASDMPRLHLDWYRGSAKMLNMTPMEWGTWPASITPMVMRTEVVLDLLDALGEPREFGPCSDRLCSALGGGATEFTLYTMYAATKAKFDCIHAIERRAEGNEVAVSIWRGNTEDAEEKAATISQVRAIAEHDPNQSGDTMFFGIQAGALSVFSGDERYELLGLLADVYNNASLNWFQTWDGMARCLG